MNQTERFYKIEQLLHERKAASFRQLLDAVEVSPATLKRDLQYLRDRLNAPIIYDRDANGYRFDVPQRHAPKHQLPGLWFNASEIHALLTMQTLLEEVQPGLLGPHIAPLQTRLKNLLGSQDSADFVAACGAQLALEFAYASWAEQNLDQAATCDSAMGASGAALSKSGCTSNGC